MTQLSECKLIRNFFSWLRNQTNAVQVDEQLLTNSRTARTSQRLLQASAIVNALTPLLLIGIMSVSDITQDPTTGITPSERERIQAAVTIAKHAEEVGLDVFALTRVAEG